jgi:hypothetical protein
MMAVNVIIKKELPVAYSVEYSLPYEIEFYHSLEQNISV